MAKIGCILRKQLINDYVTFVTGSTSPRGFVYYFHFNTWRRKIAMEFRFNFSCDLEEKDGENSSNFCDLFLFYRSVTRDINVIYVSAVTLCI